MNTDDKKYLVRSYRLSRHAVNALENLIKRLSKEAGINLSRGKVLEILIFYARSKKFEEIMDFKKKESSDAEE